jgi:hypothetical protein
MTTNNIFVINIWLSWLVGVRVGSRCLPLAPVASIIVYFAVCIDTSVEELAYALLWLHCDSLRCRQVSIKPDVLTVADVAVMVSSGKMPCSIEVSQELAGFTYKEGENGSEAWCSPFATMKDVRFSQRSL